MCHCYYWELYYNSVAAIFSQMRAMCFFLYQSKRTNLIMIFCSQEKYSSYIFFYIIKTLGLIKDKLEKFATVSIFAKSIKISKECLVYQHPKASIEYILLYDVKKHIFTSSKQLVLDFVQIAYQRHGAIWHPSFFRES